MRSNRCECSQEPDPHTKIREQLESEFAKSSSLLYENSRIKDEYGRVVQFLRQLLLKEDESEVELLSSEVMQLRTENDHLRNLLLLGTHSFANEISSEGDNYNKSLPSEHSSFYLMTPPRSPSHVHPHGKHPVRRGTSNRTGLISPPLVSPSTSIVHEIQLQGLLSDIADVGPPMSPPPDVSVSLPHRRDDPTDISDTADAKEAEKGTQDVDNDLSASN